MYQTAFLIYVLCFTISSVLSETNLPYFRAAEWGKCPKLPSQKDFSVKKFDGLWYYVAGYSSKYTPCQRFNMTATSEFEMNADLLIQEGRSPVFVKLSAKVDTPDHSEPGALHWRWNLASMIHEDFTVLSTDYENYATIFECHEFLFFHKKSLLIITKDKEYNETSLEMEMTPVNKLYRTSEYNWRRFIYNRWSNYMWCPDTETPTIEYGVGKALKEFLQVVNSYTLRL